MAAAAALAMHGLVLVSGTPRAKASSSSAVVVPMTVRSIAAQADPVRSHRPDAIAATEPSPVGAVPVPAPAPATAPIAAATLAIADLRSPSPSARPATASAAPPAPPLASAERPAPAKPQAADTPPALPPAPEYLLGAALDPGPQPIGEIEPQYPESANLQEGTVVIRVLISDAGHVDNVAVVRSAPKGLFEEAAMDAFSKARFLPARAGGVAVKSQMTVEVHFLPINRGSRISGRGY